MGNHRGVEIEIDGQSWFAIPMRIGPIDAERRKLFAWVTDAADAYGQAIGSGERGEEFQKRFETYCEASCAFAACMFEENHPDDAKSIAARCTIREVNGLIEIFTSGRLPEDFTTAGKAPEK